MFTLARTRVSPYVPLLVVFTVALIGAAVFAPNAWLPGAFDLALVSLAAYRLARITAFEPICEPIRTTCVGKPGIRGAIGEALSCPLCCGAWYAAALTYGLLLVPHEARLVAFVFAAAGIAEFANHVVSLVHAHQEIAIKQRDQEWRW